MLEQDERMLIVNSFCGAADSIRESFRELAGEMQRPSVLFRPTISLDGNKWIALLGENLQVGVAGIGDSPHEAMRDFDRVWYAKHGSEVSSG